MGHVRNYTIGDVLARVKSMQGYNVLHPMGWDSFGLPAEQYAIKTGQHPKITTESNILKFKEQLNKLGLSFDWDREVRTSDSEYYKWTQWIFLKLYNSYFDKSKNKAEPIENLRIPKNLKNEEKIDFIDSKTEKEFLTIFESIKNEKAKKIYNSIKKYNSFKEWWKVWKENKKKTTDKKIIYFRTLIKLTHTSYSKKNKQ